MNALRGTAGRAAATVNAWVHTANTWGSTPEERAQPLPCDRHVPCADVVLHRAIDVDAPPTTVFRWLCQLRAAPYSYDLIDNFGRRSPRQLTPGLDELAIGQRFMTIFDLVEFERDRHITLVVREPARWAFGTSSISYAVRPREGGARLLVRVTSRRSSRLLPWLDLVMMRRQLLTLKGLAEGD